jgi:hypothetical protein
MGIVPVVIFLRMGITHLTLIMMRNLNLNMKRILNFMNLKKMRRMMMTTMVEAFPLPPLYVDLIHTEAIHVQVVIVHVLSVKSIV